jgi:UDP-3-O-[3-hydroxymyristoyl] glucosamine N-acyltransferase
MNNGAFFKSPVRSQYLVDLIRSLVKGFELFGQDDIELVGICDSRGGGARQLVFTSAKTYAASKDLNQCFVLIDEMPCGSICGSNQFCVVSDPRAVFIDLLGLLTSEVGVEAHSCGYSSQAVVSEGAQIAKSAVIESGVEVDAGSIICEGAVVKRGTKIGKNTIIRENAVIGCDGITVYKAADGRLLRFPHVGGVYIGDNTEIGSCAVIVGGVLAPTYIGNDVVIGNLCNVGHGVCIEDRVWMSVGTLIGGHTSVGAGSTIAMGVRVRDNIEIGAMASLGMGSVVVRNVESGYSVFGNPAKRMVGLRTGPER